MVTTLKFQDAGYISYAFAGPEQNFIAGQISSYWYSLCISMYRDMVLLYFQYLRNLLLQESH